MRSVRRKRITGRAERVKDRERERSSRKKEGKMEALEREREKGGRIGGSYVSHQGVCTEEG